MAEIVCTQNTVGMHQGSCVVCDSKDVSTNCGICPACSCDEKAMKSLMFYGRLDKARAIRASKAKRGSK